MTTERDLGRLEGKVDALIKAVAEQGQRADDSRNRLYERVEKVETSVRIAGQTAAQARDEVKSVKHGLKMLGELVEKEVKPVTDDVVRMRKVGLGILGIIGLSGTLFGAAVAQPIKQFFDMLARFLSS